MAPRRVAHPVVVAAEEQQGKLGDGALEGRRRLGLRRSRRRLVASAIGDEDASNVGGRTGPGEAAAEAGDPEPDVRTTGVEREGDAAGGARSREL